MTTEQLKPCPFCGGECDPHGWVSAGGYDGPECNDCGATACSVTEWNRRTPVELSAQTAVKTEQPSLIITLRQAEGLLKFFGGHDCWVTVTGPLSAWEKTEPGLYAYCTEYPEDGASYLGKTEVDHDLAMHGRKGKTEQPSLSDAQIEIAINVVQDAILEYGNAIRRGDTSHERSLSFKAAMKSVRALLAQRQDSDKDADK